MTESDNTANTIDKENNEPGNVLLAIIGAAIAAFVGALVWVALVFFIAYRAGYLLPGIGYLVGKVIHKVKGNGYGLRFGMMGAFFAFCGCFFANFLYVLIANYNTDINEIIPGDSRHAELSFIAHAMLDRLRLSSIVLYGFAIYLGYTMSYKEHPKFINK